MFAIIFTHFISYISEIPKEKYKNIFKGAYEDQKSTFQRIKHEKSRRYISEFYIIYTI